MKYGELSKDITNEIVSKRIELTNIERELFQNWEKSKRDLNKLQDSCKHEHAVVKQGWQGGGIYYCYCSCIECGKKGGRFIPQYHMHMKNSWHANRPEFQITLEEAISIGKEIGDSILDSRYWWGEVEDYDRLIKDKSAGCV